MFINRRRTLAEGKQGRFARRGAQGVGMLGRVMPHDLC